MPIVLILARFVPGRAKQVVAFVAGIIFYAWGDPKMLIPILISIIIHFITGIEIESYDDTGNVLARTLALWTTVFIDVAVLAVFKYTSISFPIGLSFYTFSALSYIFDVYYDKTPASRNIFDLALYISFFPKVTSGPIVQYKDFIDQLNDYDSSYENIGPGLFLFMTGLFKKVLIADNLGAIFASIAGLEKMAGATAWLGAIMYSLQLYFDFSGYSDMAIGLSRCFGFRFKKNFDYPYLSKNISEFWRRWHISLGAWFRDYIYIPLGGNRGSGLMQLRNLLVVWILTGIWHGSTWNFVFWGLFHGFFVIIERFLIRDSFDRIPSVIRTIVTDIIVCIGWVMFFSPSMKSALSYLKVMFGGGGEKFFNAQTWFYLRGNLVLIILAFILATPLVKRLHDRLLYERWGNARKVTIGIYAVLFILTVAFMVSATYSSFLYFQF